MGRAVGRLVPAHASTWIRRVRPPRRGISLPLGPPVSPAPALSACSGWTGCHHSAEAGVSLRLFSAGTTSAPRRHRSSSWRRYVPRRQRRLIAAAGPGSNGVDHPGGRRSRLSPAALFRATDRGPGRSTGGDRIRSRDAWQMHRLGYGRPERPGLLRHPAPQLKDLAQSGSAGLLCHRPGAGARVTMPASWAPYPFRGCSWIITAPGTRASTSPYRDYPKRNKNPSDLPRTIFSNVTVYSIFIPSLSPSFRPSLLLTRPSRHRCFLPGDQPRRCEQLPALSPGIDGPGPTTASNLAIPR